MNKKHILSEHDIIWSKQTKKKSIAGQVMNYISKNFHCPNKYIDKNDPDWIKKIIL